MILRNFDFFNQRLSYDPHNQVVIRFYESNQDESISGVFKELSIGKVLFYRLENELFIDVDERRYHLADVRKYKEINNEGVLTLEDSKGKLELKEPLQSSALDDPFTMTADDDFQFLKYINNIRSSKEKQEVIFNYK